MPDSIPTRVARGVRYLDDHKPEWRRQIDAAKLDMGHCQKCILGQLFHTFWSSQGKRLLAVDGYSGETYMIMTANLGMNITTDENYGEGENEPVWDDLTAEWRKHLSNPEYIKEFQ